MPSLLPSGLFLTWPRKKLAAIREAQIFLKVYFSNYQIKQKTILKFNFIVMTQFYHTKLLVITLAEQKIVLVTIIVRNQHNELRIQNN